jgi:4-hydroxy-tetrahydrodipicolinate synthase
MGSDGGKAPFPQGIWAAVPTSFLPDESLDLAGIAQNVRHFRDALGLKGIFCNGLMGEGWSLPLAERRQILETKLAAADARMAVGVVTTHGGIGETLQLSRHALEAGADHVVLMRPPGLFSPSELADFVRLVAREIRGKLILFDSEAQSGGYPAALIRELGEEGLVHAVKCTRGADAIGALRAQCGALVTICDPYEDHALANLVRHDAQVLYADPEPYLFQTARLRLINDYFEAHARGDNRGMLDVYQRVEPLRRVYEHWIQTPLLCGEPINAALKHWCRRIGLAAGPVRRPLHELANDRAAALNADLDAAFVEVFHAPLSLQAG